MTEFRVKDWAKIFENSKTKELKRLEWVPVPNKMDGAGYTELVDHPNGAAHLGAWLAILEIASKQTVRGELPVSSTGTAAALARISRLPVSLFNEVLPRLVAIKWVDQLTQANQQPDEIRQISTGVTVFPPLKGNGIERELKGNGREENPCATAEAVAPVAVSGRVVAIKTTDEIATWYYEEFYPIFPLHKAGKAGLKAARVELKTAELRATALAELQRQLPELRARDPAKCPYPATWINGRRWEDEPTTLFDSKPVDKNQIRREETLKMANLLRQTGGANVAKPV